VTISALRKGVSRPLFAVLMATSVLTASTIAVPAAAQETKAYDIAAGPLADVLNRFARQAGVELAYPAGLTADLSSSGLHGSFGNAEALSRILAGSGLTFRQTGPRGFTIEPAPQAAGDTVRLGPVRVAGDADRPAIGMEPDATSPVGHFVAARTVTATKTDTPLVEVPQSISVVTREQIVAQGAQTVQEGLRYTPGVTADQQGADTRRDYVMIRGFMAPFLLDGIRGPYEGNLTNGRAESYGLERIEVLRGPSSVLYGQNVPGGLINLVSKRPTADPLREVQLQFGSYKRLQGAFDLSGPLNGEGTFLYRLTGLARDADTQVDHVNNDRLFIAPAFTWKPNDATMLTLLTQYTRDRSATGLGYLPAVGTLYDNPNGRIPTSRFVGEPGFDHYNRDSWSIGYAFEQKLGDHITFRQNLKYTDVDFEYGYLFALGLQPDLRTVNRFGGAGYRDTTLFGVDNHLQADFSTGAVEHVLLAGLDYSRRTLNTALSSVSQPPLDIFQPSYGASVNTPPTTYSQGQREYRTGLYIQDQMKAGQFVLTLGGRQDWSISKTRNRLSLASTRQEDEAFTWRAGITYLAGGGLAPYLSYSESFDPISGADWDGQPFKPTEGRQFEAGIKYQPEGSRSLVTVSVFDLRQRNVTTADLAHQCGTFDDPRCGDFETQTGEVRIRGAELEAKASLGDNFDLTGSATYLATKVVKDNDPELLGKRLTDTPRFQASLWADYRLVNGPLSGITLGGGIRYVGARYGTSSNTLDLPIYGIVPSRVPDVTLFDAVLKYDLAFLTPAMDGVSLTVNASNLFDKTYVAGCQSERTCFYGPRRTVFATINYRF